MDGAELRRRRLVLGLTQEKLARIFLVSMNSVNRWERSVQPAIAWPLLDLALCELERRRAEGTL